MPARETRHFVRWWDDVAGRGRVALIENHTGDSRGALRRWHAFIVAAGRFAGWLVEYHPGGAYAGAGSSVDFVHDHVAAQLCAWPSGCIDTYTMRIPEDPEPVYGHVEVDSEEAIGAYARAFEEQVLALRRNNSPFTSEAS